jgi:hypothetical protein
MATFPVTQVSDLNEAIQMVVRDFRLRNEALLIKRMKLLLEDSAPESWPVPITKADLRALLAR